MKKKVFRMFVIHNILVLFIAFALHKLYSKFNWE